jgi:hypothetical protein
MGLQWMITLVAVFLCAEAQADWVRVYQDTAGSVYFDPTTVKARNSVRRFWTLMDFPMMPGEQPLSSLSSVSEFEIDCREARSRNLYTESRALNMGKGEIVSTPRETPSEWIPIPPGSSRDNLMKKVCRDAKVPSKNQRTPIPKRDIGGQIGV